MGWVLLGVIMLIAVVASGFSTFAEKAALKERESRHKAWRDRSEAQRKATEATWERVQAQIEKQAEQLLVKHHNLVQAFYQIAERRVAVLDEYGEESWRTLPKAILECVCKVGDREGIDQRTIRDLLKESTPKPSLGFARGHQALVLRLGLAPVPLTRS
jgi:hypothetical protein